MSGASDYWERRLLGGVTAKGSSIDPDRVFCDEHRELADLLIEHGCAPAGEDRDLLRALVGFIDLLPRGDK